MDQRKSIKRAYQHYHSQLGAINGVQATGDLIQFRSIPYAQIPRRFARSTVLYHLPRSTGQSGPYDARNDGPCSVQPLNSVETDVRWNQLPECPTREQVQGEDCLRLTLTCPMKTLNHGMNKIPVMVFIHGGALMIGSGNLFSNRDSRWTLAVTNVYR